MSHYSEHRRMEPVLKKARELDIASNPAPEAIFEAITAGVNVWATPDDHPRDWGEAAVNRMDKGTYVKRCGFVGTATWGWNDDETITYLSLETDAYVLRDARQVSGNKIHNRPADLAWTKRKIRWLLKQAGVPCPPIRTQKDDDALR